MTAIARLAPLAMLTACASTGAVPVAAPGSMSDPRRFDRDESVAAETLTARIYADQEGRGTKNGTGIVIGQDDKSVYILAPLHLFCSTDALDDKACVAGVANARVNLYREFDSKNESRRLLSTGIFSAKDWTIVKSDISNRPWYPGQRAWARLGSPNDVVDGAGGQLFGYCQPEKLPCQLSGNLAVNSASAPDMVGLVQARAVLRHDGDHAPEKVLGGEGSSGSALFTDTWHFIGMHIEEGGKTESLLVRPILADQRLKSVPVCLVDWRPPNQTERRMRSWGRATMIGGAVVAGLGVLTIGVAAVQRRWLRPSEESASASWKDETNTALWVGYGSTVLGGAAMAGGYLFWNQMLPPVPKCGE